MNQVAVAVFPGVRLGPVGARVPAGVAVFAFAGGEMSAPAVAVSWLGVSEGVGVLDCAARTVCVNRAGVLVRSTGVQVARRVSWISPAAPVGLASGGGTRLRGPPTRRTTPSASKHTRMVASRIASVRPIRNWRRGGLVMR